MASPCLSRIACGVFLATVARADVLHVGGPQPDFDTLSAAVDHALEGDLVLVWPGTYSAFTIQASGCAVAAAQSAGSVVIHGTIVVRDLSPSSTAVLVDLDVQGQLSPALVIENSAGAVRVQGGTYRGADGGVFVGPPSPALRASHDTNLVLVDVQLHGGSALTTFNAFLPALAGAPAIVANDLTLAAYGGVFSGGTGGDLANQSIQPGGAGGHAFAATETFIFTSGSTFAAGGGGRGGSARAFAPAGNGGNGGHAILAVGCELVLVGATLVPGNAGDPGFSSNGSGTAGADGQALEVSGSTVTQHTEGTREFTAPRVGRRGSNATLYFEGETGELVLLLTALGDDFLFHAPWGGVRLVGVPVARRLVGTIGVEGALELDLPLFLAPGTRVVLQPVWLGATQPIIGSARQLFVLE